MKAAIIDQLLTEERALFDFERIAEAVADMRVRRHPHVFGEAVARTKLR
ncbi:hypothetical protein RP726_13865 [Candidatus Methylospira mobilis]|nr:hypothetical protein [Candidatus Methylospira mobilis]WNV03532.1 hypothetical protein RP726_13865 [Candidatus Methylospira mobilis]